MKKISSIFDLFITMFKIGLFTIGGGYAMISVLENEFVNKKQYLTSDEFANLVVIAESTPGPIAINCSTYIGYRKEGILGAIFATLGMILPSMTIIYIISLFFDQFLAIEWVKAAFKGIQICVVFLIISAGIKMIVKMKKTVVNYVLFILTILLMILFDLLSVNFSSIFFILIAALIGVIIHFIVNHKNEEDNKENNI